MEDSSLVSVLLETAAMDYTRGLNLLTTVFAEANASHFETTLELVGQAGLMGKYFRALGFLVGKYALGE